PEPPKEAPKEVRGPSPVAGPTQETKTEAREEAEEIRSSPLVRRIAKENRVDLSELAGKGTGINGRITKSDILSYIEQGGKKEAGVRRPSPPPPPPPTVTFTGEVERVPLTPMRKAIAEHMVMSRRTSAHVTTFFEVDCSHIMKAKEKQQAEF